jgi:thiol:disulfide interchange protein DsbA
MSLHKAWFLAALLVVAACGGTADDPAATDPLLGGAASSETDIAEPELVASDPSGEPTEGRFELGVHYLRLSPTQPTSSGPEQVEVCEVFWYGCPHCFNFDPLLERWRQTIPEYVSFVRVPAVWNPLLQLHARAFYTAEALGKGAEMHSEFFREIHERGNALDTEAKLQAFFGRFDVEPTAFKTAFDSFAVHAKLQRADELSRRYRIQSVPTIIVNGKYTTDGGQVGSYEELLALVDELTAAERAAR